MAIDYTNLFEDLGEWVQTVTLLLTYSDDSGTLDVRENQTVNDLNSTNATYDLASIVPEMFNGYRDTVVGWISEIVSQVERRLTHRDTILEQLALGDKAGLDDVLIELYRDMIANSKTVNQSTYTIGGASSTSVTPATVVLSNSDDAAILVNGTLDGASEPGEGMIANQRYLGESTQLPIPETMYFTCVSDADNDGVTEGQEDFEWVGQPGGSSLFDWRTQGSGTGPNLRSLDAAGFIQNGQFEGWTVSSTVPDAWVFSSGSTLVQRITSVSTPTPKRGDSAIKIIGTGAATCTFYQTLSGLTPGKRYCFAFFLNADATYTGGDFTVRLVGTGTPTYTPGGTETVTLNAATLAALGGWVLTYRFLTLPMELPATMDLQISLATPGASKWVAIDGLCFGEVTWNNGVCAAAIPGAGNWVRGDRYSIAIARTGTGVFQDFFRKAFGFQLPASGAPSIADGLASDS